MQKQNNILFASFHHIQMRYFSIKFNSCSYILVWTFHMSPETPGFDSELILHTASRHKNVNYRRNFTPKLRILSWIGPINHLFNESTELPTCKISVWIIYHYMNVENHIIKNEGYCFSQTKLKCVKYISVN